MKNKIIPIISVLIGIIAFILTYQYLSGEQRKLQQLKDAIARGTRQVQIVGAKTDIPGGTAVSLDDLELISMPEAFVPEQAVTTQEEVKMIAGKKTLVEVKAHKPLLWSNIEGGAQTGLGLAPAITHRMRAISLAISGASAVSGMVQPNDRVDVLGTFSFPSKIPGEMETVTLTVLQDVTVLATGQTLAKEKVFTRRRTTSSSGYSTVTLEVTPREAELLVFAQQIKGSLSLALRNPTDSSFETDLPEVNFSKIKNELPDLNAYRQKQIRQKR